MDTSLVILDPGSQTFKAGFTFTYPSEEEPRLITPNAVEVRGQAPDQQTDAGAASSADVLDVIHPVQQGQIKDMDGLEALIHYSLYEMLGWEVGVEGSVLMAEPLLTSKRERELLTQLMFEVFNVYGLYFQDPATLALYALGRLTGCVVDIGHGKIDVSTVTEGQVRMHMLMLHGVHAHACRHPAMFDALSWFVSRCQTLKSGSCINCDLLCLGVRTPSGTSYNSHCQPLYPTRAVPGKESNMQHCMRLMHPEHVPAWMRCASCSML